MRLFEKRLNKALKQDFKSTSEIVDYCKKETNKNYSDAKVREFQCICEFLIYRLEHKTNINFNEYQEIQFKEIWGWKRENLSFYFVQ